MEVLVQWFTDNLSQFISAEMVIFIISMVPILELRGGLLADVYKRQVQGRSPLAFMRAARKILLLKPPLQKWKLQNVNGKHINKKRMLIWKENYLSRL